MGSMLAVHDLAFQSTAFCGKQLGLFKESRSDRFRRSEMDAFS